MNNSIFKKIYFSVIALLVIAYLALVYLSYKTKTPKSIVEDKEMQALNNLNLSAQNSGITADQKADILNSLAEESSGAKELTDEEKAKIIESFN